MPKEEMLVRPKNIQLTHMPVLVKNEVNSIKI